MAQLLKQLGQRPQDVRVQGRAPGGHRAEGITLEEIGPGRRNLLYTPRVVLKEEDALCVYPSVFDQVEGPPMKGMERMSDTKLTLLVTRDGCSRGGT